MRLLSTILLLALGLSLSAQASSRDDIITAIKSADAAALSSYAAKELALCFYDDEDIVSRQVAKTKLATFFETRPVKSFQLRHNGGSDGNKSNYFVGNLVTAEKKYRVFVYTEAAQNGGLLIKELRFEKAL